ncbi:MAG: MATE family efflux transporter [Clostridia bacterium]|nr:MATE family efflux transporter [Clostridia bacterium]
MKENRFEIDMCTGALMPKLISFSLPLMFSNALQLLFNAVDLIVVGRFAGSQCLAAVGSNTALINIMTALFMGLSLGANVCAARFYASREYKKMSEVVHTSISIAVISGAFILIFGQLIAHPALKLLGTPDDIINLSKLYLRIYLLGTPFSMLYNFGAAILRAVGDTKRPMIFLIIAGIVNAGLNVFLVVVFHMDVAGVAIATIISQLISCVLVIRVLFKSPDAYKIKMNELKIHPKHLKNIVSIGVPAGLQGIVINASNAMLQSSVNSFGANAMAGYTAANNIFGFLYTSANSITQACMSFTSQNLGAGKYKRMKSVLFNCLILETVVCLMLGAVAYFFGDKIIGIYSSSPVVIEYGLQILSLTTLTYFLCGYMDCIPGALRGMGHSAVPMILSIIGTVGTRIVWIYGIFPHHRDMKFLFISYPASWIATIIMQSICYFIIIRKFSGDTVSESEVL